jgi:hypothetical protein
MEGEAPEAKLFVRFHDEVRVFLDEIVLVLKLEAHSLREPGPGLVVPAVFRWTSTDSRIPFSSYERSEIVPRIWPILVRSAGVVGFMPT